MGRVLDGGSVFGEFEGFVGFIQEEMGVVPKMPPGRILIRGFVPGVTLVSSFLWLNFSLSSAFSLERNFLATLSHFKVSKIYIFIHSVMQI